MALAITCIIMNAVVTYINGYTFVHSGKYVDLLSAMAWAASTLFWIERVILWQ